MNEIGISKFMKNFEFVVVWIFIANQMIVELPYDLQKFDQIL